MTTQSTWYPTEVRDRITIQVLDRILDQRPT